MTFFDLRKVSIWTIYCFLE